MKGETRRPNNAPLRRPADLQDSDFKNRQLDLFKSFPAEVERGPDYARQHGALSNMVEKWDLFPRFSVNLKKQARMRTAEGTLPVLRHEFHLRSIEYRVEIRPARLELRGKDGKPSGHFMEFYPSAREELVEHTLRKIALSNGRGFFDAHQRAGVVFSLHQLRKELQAHGHAFDHSVLIDSLDILNLANIRVVQCQGGTTTREVLVSEAYLPSLVSASACSRAAGFPPCAGKASPKAREWFSDFLRDIGLRDETPNARIVGMHAFRFTLLNRAMVLRIAGAEAITGHTSNVTKIRRVTEGQVEDDRSEVVMHYQGALPVDQKMEILERITYGDLKFHRPVTARSRQSAIPQ